MPASTLSALPLILHIDSKHKHESVVLVARTARGRVDRLVHIGKSRYECFVHSDSNRFENREDNELFWRCFEIIPSVDSDDRGNNKKSRVPCVYSTRGRDGSTLLSAYYMFPTSTKDCGCTVKIRAATRLQTFCFMRHKQQRPLCVQSTGLFQG